MFSGITMIGILGLVLDACLRGLLLLAAPSRDDFGYSQFGEVAEGVLADVVVKIAAHRVPSFSR